MNFHQRVCEKYSLNCKSKSSRYTQIHTLLSTYFDFMHKIDLSKDLHETMKGAKVSKAKEKARLWLIKSYKEI